METIFEYIHLIRMFESMNRIDSIGEIRLTRDNGSYAIITGYWDVICTTYEEFYTLVCSIKKHFHDENKVYSYYDLKTGEAFDI